MPEHHVGADLASIEFLSGVNEAGEPFCTIRCEGADVDGERITMVGQMPPDRLRRIASQALEVAEAAVMDAAVYGFFQAACGMDQDTAGMAVAHLRVFRADALGDDDQTFGEPGDGE